MVCINKKIRFKYEFYFLNLKYWKRIINNYKNFKVLNICTREINIYIIKFPTISEFSMNINFTILKIYYLITNIYFFLLLLKFFIIYYCSVNQLEVYY